MSWHFLPLLVLAALLQTGAAFMVVAAPQPAAVPRTVSELLLMNPELHYAHTLLDTLPSSQFLIRSTTEVYTLFVPTHTAIELLAQTLGLTVDGLLPKYGAQLLAHLVNYHFVPSVVINTAANLPASLKVASALPGYNLTVIEYTEGTSQAVFVKGKESIAIVTEANMMAGKAIVHAVDRVLIPFNLNNPPAKVADYRTLGDALKFLGLKNETEMIELSGLHSMLTRTGLEGTLFAPTDAAWDAAFAILTGPGLANVLNTSAVIAVDERTLVDHNFRSYLDRVIFYDRFHAGQALSYSDLASLSSLAVGSDPAVYNTPAGDKVLLKAVNGTLQVSTVTTANIITPNIYVGSGCKLVIHIVDGVPVTFKTAALLGVLRNPPPPYRRSLRA